VDEEKWEGPGKAEGDEVREELGTPVWRRRHSVLAWRAISELVILDDSETRRGGMGARGGALDRGKARSSGRERTQQEGERQREDAMRREEDDWGLHRERIKWGRKMDEASRAVTQWRADPPIGARTLFIRRVREWGLFTSWIGQPTFHADVGNFFWRTWIGFHYIELRKL
jgi:hypothetical protein